MLSPLFFYLFILIYIIAVSETDVITTFNLSLSQAINQSLNSIQLNNKFARQFERS